MKRNALSRIIVIFLSSAVCLFCAIPLGYLTIFSWVDQVICIPRIAERIGVRSTSEAILLYALDSLEIGMTREDVISQLETLAPVNHFVGKESVAESGITTDQITINICLFPQNNIFIEAQFENGKLIWWGPDS